MIDSSESQRRRTYSEVSDQASVMEEARGSANALESDELSIPFVGRWNQLISQTNWEKGKIIYEWRQAQIASQSPPSAYRDDLWAAAVGGITPQHVGRLRRVYERFGDGYATYQHLYWTHFLAALDWDDAELWLEGASKGRMSVSEMRRTRWQALGSLPESKPNPADVVSNTLDEDFVPVPESKSSSDEADFQSQPLDEGPDFGSTNKTDSAAVGHSFSDDVSDVPFSTQSASPFASLPELPSDIAEALDQFQLAIIRHRSAGWAECSKEDMLKVVESLRLFILSE